jgi:FdhD protein
MNSKYKILKYKSQNTNDVEDLVSIEEPLEISIKFKENDTFQKKNYFRNNENSR